VRLRVLRRSATSNALSDLSAMARDLARVLADGLKRAVVDSEKLSEFRWFKKCAEISPVKP
jgi:hypothetical protein